MLILWSVAVYDPNGPDKNKNKIEEEIIGHVSVKPFGRAKWESKVSTAPWVCFQSHSCLYKYAKIVVFRLFFMTRALSQSTRKAEGF